MVRDLRDLGLFSSKFAHYQKEVEDEVLRGDITVGCQGFLVDTREEVDEETSCRATTASAVI
jgi:hypothetical protein